jgi:hypothetical protein
MHKAIKDASIIKDYKLGYALQKNITKIKSYIEEVENALKPTEKYQEYLQESQRNGGITVNALAMVGDFETAKVQIGIDKKYADEIHFINTRNKEANELLEKEEVDIDFFQIEKSYIEGLKDDIKNQLTGSIQMGLIPEIIKE